MRTKTPFLLQSSSIRLSWGSEVDAEMAFTAVSRTADEQSSVLSGRTRTLTPNVKAEANREVGMEKARFEVFKSSHSVVSVFVPPEIGISKVYTLTSAGSTAKYFRESSLLLSWDLKMYEYFVTLRSNRYEVALRLLMRKQSSRYLFLGKLILSSNW